MAARDAKSGSARGADSTFAPVQSGRVMSAALTDGPPPQGPAVVVRRPGVAIPRTSLLQRQQEAPHEAADVAFPPAAGYAREGLAPTAASAPPCPAWIAAASCWPPVLGR